jgi:hypothetical protein
MQYARIIPLILKNVYQGKPAGEGKKKVIKKPPREQAPVPTLLQAADKHIASFAKMVEKKLRSGEPLKQWRSTRKKIEEFILFEYQCCDIDLPDIEFSFAAKFYNYLFQIFLRNQLILLSTFHLHISLYKCRQMRLRRFRLKEGS